MIVSETIKAEEWRISNTGTTQVTPNDFPSLINGCSEQIFSMYLYYSGDGVFNYQDYNVHVELKGEIANLQIAEIKKRIQISLSLDKETWKPLNFSTQNGIVKASLNNYIKGLYENKTQAFHIKFESIGVGISGSVAFTARRSRTGALNVSATAESGTILFDNIVNATTIALKPASDGEIEIGEKAVTFNVKNACYSTTWGKPYLRIVSTADPRSYLTVNDNEFTLENSGEYIIDIELPKNNITNGSDNQVTLKAKPNAPDGTFNFRYYVVGGQSKDRWGSGYFDQVVHVLGKAKLTMPKTLPSVISDCAERDYSIKVSSPFYHNVTVGALEITSDIDPAGIFSLVYGQDTIEFTNKKAYIDLPFGSDGASTINLSIIPLTAKSDNDITLTYRVVESKDDLTQWGSGSLSHTFGLHTSKSTTLSLINGVDNNITIGEKTVPVNVGNPCYNSGWGIPYLRIISTKDPNNFMSINGYQFSPGSPEEYYLDIPLSGDSIKNSIAKDLRIIAEPNAPDTSFVFTYYVVGGQNKDRWGNESIIQTVNILEKVKIITQPEHITPDTVIDCGGHDYSLCISSPFYHDETAGTLEITSDIDPAGIFSLVYGPDTIEFTNQKAYINLLFDSDSTSTIDLRIVPLVAKSDNDITLTYRVVESAQGLSPWGTDSLDHTFGLHASESTMLYFSSVEHHDITIGEDTVHIHVGNECYNDSWGSVYLRVVSPEDPTNYMTINGQQFNQENSGHYFLDIPLSGDSVRSTIAKGLEICAKSDAPDTTFVFTYYVFGGETNVVRWESDSVIQTVSILEKVKFNTQQEDITPGAAINCEGYNYTLNISSSIAKDITAGALEITSNIPPGAVFSLANGQTPVSFNQLKTYIPLTFDNNGNASVDLNILALPAARDENVILAYRIVESESNPEQWGTGSLNHSLTMNALHGTNLTLENLSALQEQLTSLGNVVGCNGLVLDLLISSNDCQSGLDGYILLDTEFNNPSGNGLSSSVSIESANGSVIDFMGNTNKIRLEFELDADGKFRDQVTIKPLHQAFKSSTFGITSCKAYTDADELLKDASAQMGILSGITLDPAGLQQTPVATTLSIGMNSQETFAASDSLIFTADINTTECMTGAAGTVIFKLSDPNDSTHIKMYLDDRSNLKFVNGEAHYTFTAGINNSFTYSIKCFAGLDEVVPIPMVCSLYYNGIECMSSNHLLVINGEKSYISVLSQPQGAPICKGNDYTMGIKVDGQNINYQWYKGNSEIKGATDSEYSIIDASFKDRDTYYVVVWNNADTITSNKVKIWIAEPLTKLPEFLECPGTVMIGQPYRISLEYYPDIISYKWNYSKPGADFSIISNDAHTMNVIFSADALGQGILSVEMEHPCGTYTISRNISITQDGGYGTGIEHLIPETLQIYLDPETQELIVKNESQTINHLIVSDINGRIVYQAEPAVTCCRILAAHWPAGVYIIRATTDTKSTVHKVLKR